MSTTHAMTKLDRKTWGEKIGHYIIALATKREADAASRSADSTIKTIRSELRGAMNGAPVALCGNAVLTAKSTAPAEAAITLTDGRKVAWSKVTSLLVGNERIDAADVQSIYGGRSGNESIDVAGSP